MKYLFVCLLILPITLAAQNVAGLRYDGFYVYDNNVNTTKNIIKNDSVFNLILKSTYINENMSIKNRLHAEFLDDCYPKGTKWEGLNGGPRIEAMSFTKSGIFFYQTACRNTNSWNRMQKFFKWCIENELKVKKEVNEFKVSNIKRVSTNRYIFYTTPETNFRDDYTQSSQMATIFPDRVVITWNFPPSFYQAKVHLIFPELLQPRVFWFYRNGVVPPSFLAQRKSE